MTKMLCGPLTQW